jgi:hypothetical protein
MSEPSINIMLYDDETLSADIPDSALELAAGKPGQGPAISVTVAFCSGIDSCPSHPQR